MRFDNEASLLASVEAFLKANKLERALRDIQAFVSRVFAEPHYAGRLFSSASLDRACARVGRAVLSAGQASLASTKRQPGHTYVATELYNSGGHTALIDELIRVAPDVHHHILLTDSRGGGDRGVPQQRFANQAGVTVEWSPSKNPVETLCWIQGRLIELASSRVYLLQHSEDAVAVAAAEAVPEGHLYFIHHGDHHLCLGVHIEHAIHIDPHVIGFRNCREVLRLPHNVHWPMCVDDSGPRCKDSPFIPGGILTTCTAANENKIDRPYPYPYAEVIPYLLEKTGGRHLHLGRLSKGTLRTLHRNLNARGVASDRFVYHSWVANVWAALQTHHVDLYLNSFPFGGGRTCIEVMGAGIPIVTHSHHASHFLGGLDLLYGGAFVWKFPDELVDIVKGLTPDMLVIHSASARLHYEQFHTPDQFRRIYAGELDCNDLTRLPPPAHFEPNYLQSCVDLIHEQTPGRALRRTASLIVRSRLARRIHAALKSTGLHLR